MAKTIFRDTLIQELDCSIEEFQFEDDSGELRFYAPGVELRFAYKTLAERRVELRKALRAMADY